MEADYTNGVPAGAEAEAQQESLTVEHLLYAGALLVAFGLRFIGLGQAPLAPFEAAQAWPAWLAVTSTQVANAPAPASALLYTLQSWLFFLAGSNDILARLVPALMGTAIVLLPWWWRSWLGRTAALVLAWLLALDPWLTALSRTSDGTILAAGFGLLAITALWNWAAAPDDRTHVRWERTLLVSVALLLLSGTQGWNWLPVLVLFAWFSSQSTSASGGFGRIRPSSWVWFAAALLLGATGLLAWPAAFGAVGASLSSWLAQWSPAGDAGLGLGWGLLRLLVDQPLLMIFGPLGLILLATGKAASRPRQLVLVLAGWAVWGLLLLLLPSRSPFALPMLGLPLAIAASLAIAWLIALPLGDVNSIELVVLVGVAVILFVAGTIWLAMAVESVTYDTRLMVTAGALSILMLGIWGVFGFWAGWQTAGKVAGLFFATVLLLMTVRSGWMLSQTGSAMAPDGLFPVTALPEARLLVTDVQRLSSIRFGDPHEAPMEVATGGRAPDAQVGWLLRDMVNLAWVTAPDPTVVITGTNGAPRTPLVVAPAGMEQDRGLAEMLGAKYPLRTRWDPSMLPTMPPADATNPNGLPPGELARLRGEQAWSIATRPQLEWLLYRTIKSEPPVDSVTLWATP